MSVYKTNTTAQNNLPDGNKMITERITDAVGTLMETALVFRQQRTAIYLDGT